MNNGYKIIVLFFLSSILVGCGNDLARAPVQNAWLQTDAQNDVYRVSKGDTLYSIAWAFGLDYRSLAQANHLHPPYSLVTGQTLVMTAHSKGIKAQQASFHDASSTAVPSLGHSSVNTQGQIPVAAWQWPARGRIVERFSTSTVGNKGVDIAGSLGEPVLASADGVVVYSGSGVRGYNHLLLVKHNDNYLSAYGYNEQVFVKLGQPVKAGQRIASMGKNNAGQVRLHFEIRRNGAPVDPLGYLG